MSPEQHNRTLRQKLWGITSGPEQAPVSEHAQRFSDLASRIPHTIKVLTSPYGNAVPLERFTCFMHVLGLAQCPSYIEIATRDPELFAGTEFMRFLLHEGVTRTCRRISRRCYKSTQSSEVGRHRYLSGTIQGKCRG